MENEIVVVAVGRDKPGLVSEVTSMIAEAKGNIEDMDQVVLRDIFIMSILVNLQSSLAKRTELKSALIRRGRKIGLRIQVYDRSGLEVSK